MEKLRKIGFSKLTTLEEAMEKLFSRITLNPNEEMKTSKALNRILGEDKNSGINVPHFDRSAMDGYAIKAEDSFGASHKNPKRVKLVGTIDIGELSNLNLNRGEVIRISTGAAIPSGADAVIKIEDTEIEEQTVILNDSIVPGKNISKKGEDIKVGTKVLESGIELKPEHLSLLELLEVFVQRHFCFLKILISNNILNTKPGISSCIGIPITRMFPSIFLLCTQI